MWFEVIGNGLNIILKVSPYWNKSSTRILYKVLHFEDKSLWGPVPIRNALFERFKQKYKFALVS